MEGTLEKDCGVLGGLFQQIINDLKNGTPLWEDLIYKATKLQTCLRATIQAIAAYLDAFQKIADAATNTRGATKEIGTALTRICLRHRAVEAKMKTFTSAIMDCLVAPLQEKLEDWKKSVVNLDKEHAREYKRARAELKKRSTDTLRLQKKIRKGGKSDDLQRAMQDVSEKKTVLEEAEKKAVKAALIEERSRYCLFVTFLKPVVEEEVAMLSELSHLQEVMDQLEKNTADPYSLPASSEQVISDLKGSDAMWTFQSPPPSSPSSIGSRKSSMCSISSLNSSSSGSSKSHHSPNHLYWNRSISQHHYHPQLTSSLSTQRLCSVSSQDSGFTSQDTLCIRNSTASYFQQQVSDMLEENINSSTESATSLAAPTATWPNLQDTLQFEKAATAIMNDRPHTISTAYERGHHQRPALSVYTFQTPENSQSQLSSSSPVTVTTAGSESSAGDSTPIVSPQSIYASTQQIYARPPVPERGSSLERPSVPAKMSASTHNGNNIVNAHLKNATERTTQPTYVNMNELANMAATKAHENASSHSNNDFGSVDNHVDKVNSECAEKESSASESSLESSSGYGSQSGISVATPTPDHDSAQSATEDVYNGIVVIRHHNHYGQYAPENPYHNPEFIRQRTHSNASTSSAGYCTIKSGTLSRRGSVQNQKPPPPIRRTSSILNTAVRCSSSSLAAPQTSSASPSSSVSVNNNGNSNNNTLENLPPPPAFLLQNSTSAAVAPGSSNSYDIYGTTIHRTNSVTSFGTGSLSSTVTSAVNTTVANIALDSASSSSSSSVSSSCSSVFVMKRSVAHSIAAEIQKRNSINTIEQIKLSKDQQPTPQRKSSFTTSTIYQSSSLSSSSSEITDGSSEEKRSWPEGRKFELEGSGISVAETVRTLTEMNHQPASPVSIRRTHSNRSISADRRQENNSLIAALSARIAPSLSPRHSRKHYQDTSKMVLPRASRVRQWIALRTVPDPTTCHDSLMDQIKRGTHLRPTGVINDRSAPPTKTNY